MNKVKAFLKLTKRKAILFCVFLVIVIFAAGYYQGSYLLDKIFFKFLTISIEPTCDLGEYNLDNTVVIKDEQFPKNIFSEVPDTIKNDVFYLVTFLPSYQRFLRKFPGASGNVVSLMVYPLKYISNPEKNEYRLLVPESIYNQAKPNSVLVRFLTSAPGVWIPEAHPIYNIYIDICNLKILR